VNKNLKKLFYLWIFSFCVILYGYSSVWDDIADGAISVYENGVDFIERKLSPKQKNKIKEKEKNQKKQKKNIEKASEGKKDKLIEALKEELNKIDKDGNINIYYAIEANDRELVQDLLFYGSNPNFTTAKENKPLLFYAIEKAADPEITNLLVKNGADVNYEYSQDNFANYTPLHAACRSGNIDKIKIILEKTKKYDILGTISNSKTTPLRMLLDLPIQNEIKVEFIKDFLKNGANPNQKCIVKELDNTSWQHTPVHYAAKENNLEILVLFNEFSRIKADFDTKDSNNLSAYDYLRQHTLNKADELNNCYLTTGNAQKFLENYGNSWDNYSGDWEISTSRDNLNFAHLALKYGDTESSQILINKYISWENKDNYGKNCLDYIFEKGREEVIKSILESGTIKLETVLFYALKNQKLDYVNNLVTENMVLNDIQIGTFEDNFATLLMYIARYGDFTFIKKVLPKMLANNPLILERKDQKGFTPFLYAAAYNEDYRVMKILRMYGANVYAKDNNGNNAYILAIKYQNDEKEEILRRLESYGVYEK